MVVEDDHVKVISNDAPVAIKEAEQHLECKITPSFIDRIQVNDIFPINLCRNRVAHSIKCST
jgi:hypothetical protein